MIAAETKRLQTPPRRVVRNLSTKRTPLKGRIVQLLAEAPCGFLGAPEAHTHESLALRLYGVEEPTAAQLAAVRRAVAALEREGLAVKLRGPVIPDGQHNAGLRLRCWHNRPRSVVTHTRGPYGDRHRNPAGVAIRRPLTDADKAIADAAHKQFAAERGWPSTEGGAQ
jgi:hypothetical protein